MTHSTANKIRAAYDGRKDIDYRNSTEAFKQTIALLTAGKLNSAWVYTGTAMTPTNIDGMLAIRPNINARVYTVVYVSHADEYHVDFVHVKKDTAEIIAESGGVYLEQLAGVYESMYDDYIHAEQGSLIRI